MLSCRALVKTLFSQGIFITQCQQSAIEFLVLQTVQMPFLEHILSSTSVNT